MGQRDVLHCPIGHRFHWMVGPKDSQRADSHHGPVGLAFRVRTRLEAGGNAHATVKGIGVEPELIGPECGIGIVESKLS